jgi:hypothetical protein
MAKRSQSLDRLWTHQETAEFLRISLATPHQMNYKKTGPRSVRVERYRRYEYSDVLEWLETRASTADVRRTVGRAP